jgi:hypothetical protein
VISNSAFVRIKRCLFTSLAATAGSAQVATLSPAIGMTGFVWGAQIHDNFFNNVGIGIGPSPIDATPFLFLAYSSIQNNEMSCMSGVEFINPRTFFLEVSFADNVVRSIVGFLFRGSGLGVSVERNSFVISAGSPSPFAFFEAIACSASESRISNNHIAGDPNNPGQHGIVLDGTAILAAQVNGNQIFGLAENGIVLKGGVLLGTIISQNQIGMLGDAGIRAEPASYALDLDISGNVIASVGLGGSAEILAGIVLPPRTVAINLKVSENVVEVVGPGPQTNICAGIWVTLVADARIAGNRIVDVGPTSPVQFGGGILIMAVVGRADVVDNEVRRASIPPLNGDASFWCALANLIVTGDANIRGNLLESFGRSPTVLMGVSRSSLFCDNQCFLDNPINSPPSMLVVQLGFKQLNAGAVIASNNFVQGPSLPNVAGGVQAAMNINPAVPAKTLTVLGNITSGNIMVGTALLGNPWAPLNVINI